MGDITTAQTKQYEDNCKLVLQQLESRARDKVMIKDMQGAEKSFVEYCGTSEPREDLERNGDTQYSNTDFQRRMITSTPYYDAKLINRPDAATIIIDPQAPQLMSMRGGFNRKIDSLLFAAMRGTSYYGKEGASTLALPTAQKVASASAGLTFEKLIAASETLNLGDVPTEEEAGSDFSRWMAIGPKQVSDLLKETEVGSADYNLVKPLSEGKVTRFMGFNFVMTNLLTLASSTRYCLAWVKAGVYLGINYDIEATVDRMPNKKNAIQLFLRMMLGASRVQENCVVEVACIES